MRLHDVQKLSFIVAHTRRHNGTQKPVMNFTCRVVRKACAHLLQELQKRPDLCVVCSSNNPRIHGDEVVHRSYPPFALESVSNRVALLDDDET